MFEERECSICKEIKIVNPMILSLPTSNLKTGEDTTFTVENGICHSCWFLLSKGIEIAMNAIKKMNKEVIHNES